MQSGAALESIAPDASETFHELAITQLKAAAEDLFDTYGCPLKVVADLPEERTTLNLALGAAIGFTSTHVRGVLAIAVDEQLARNMNPVAQAGDDGSHQDWIGELSNQLLGRLKNKLLSRGVELALSTPMIVRGTDLQLGAASSGATKVTFEDGDLSAEVWWDAEVDEGLVLTEGEDEAHAEGDMLLF